MIDVNLQRENTSKLRSAENYENRRYLRIIIIFNNLYYDRTS